MEYEICGEERLFDDSTNPSLEHPAAQSADKPRDVRSRKREPQKGFAIPEEEHQLS